MTNNQHRYIVSKKYKPLEADSPSMASEPACTNNNQVISTVDALWVLIQGQTEAVRKALTERLLAEQEKAKTQRQMVKDSLTRAFDDLHSGKVHHDARKLFS